MRENRTYGSGRGEWVACLGKQLVRHYGETQQRIRLKPEGRVAHSSTPWTPLPETFRMVHMSHSSHRSHFLRSATVNLGKYMILLLPYACM